MSAKKSARSNAKVDRVAAGAIAPDEIRQEFPRLDLPMNPPFPPMEAKSVAEIPRGEGWLYEPKWDGFRCLVFRSGDTVVLQSKAGQPLGRYFPELVQAFRTLDTRRFVLDGEIVVLRDGRLSFDDLLMRIHPAESRIRRLAQETPASFLGFDLLVDEITMAKTEGGASLAAAPLRERRKHLENFFRRVPDALKESVGPGLRLSPASFDRKMAEFWMAELAGSGFDGVVAKRLDGPYESGERSMLKIKRLRTADCVVGGFRWATKGGEVGSLLLGLYDEDGLLHHAGFTSGFSREQRKELKHILKPYSGGAASPEGHPEDPAAGAPNAPASGSGSTRNLSVRSSTTIFPATAFATELALCAGVRKSARNSVPSSRSDLRERSWETCSPREPILSFEFSILTCCEVRRRFGAPARIAQSTVLVASTRREIANFVDLPIISGSA